MCSLTYIDTFNEQETIIQMARCSFDIHVQEIFGSLMIGAALIMLHPSGTIDFHYLSEMFEKKQITFMDTVPSLINSFFLFLKKNNKQKAVQYLRSLCIGGKRFEDRF